MKLSQKTKDVLSVIENVFKIVSEQKAGYAGTMRELIREAVKQTANDYEKEYSTVVDSLTRKMGITGDGATEAACQLIEEACMNSENHLMDDLWAFVRSTINSNDDPNDARNAYLQIWK